MSTSPADPAGAAGAVPSATASIGVRIGARLLDVLIVGIPASIVLSLLGFGASMTAGFGLESWVYNAIISLLWFGYFVYFESNGGATLGKRILNLRVVQASGDDPSTEAAAKRNVWMLFGLVPFIGGLLSLAAVITINATISPNDADRGYHDTFAGTAVMR